MSIKLKGITWNHSRGYIPMVATAQRFHEMNPNVEIEWDKRTLQEFADFPVEKLIEKYDLLVIDHPFAGFAANNHVLVPLERFLPTDFLIDQANNSVGKSFESYKIDGYLTALPIDAATPVASFRPDLLENKGLKIPQSWSELLELAKKGLVALPGIPVDSLMNFYMLCASQGEEPFLNEEWIVSNEIGVQVLEQLRELANLCTPEIYNWNPIAVYEAMSSRNDIAYCPFAYGYSNYSRPGYSRYQLLFTDMVTIGAYGRIRSTLGGTGLSVSMECRDLTVALEYVQFVASPECQRTLYFENGGQPGHRSAWLDEKVNQSSANFFRETLSALDRAYLRPRYNGYMYFQDHAGAFIYDFVQNGGNPIKVLDQLNNLYYESLSRNKKKCK